MSSNRFVSYACELFDKNPERTVATINSMVFVFLKNEEFDRDLSLFTEVLGSDFSMVLKPKFVTLMVLIFGCVENRRFKLGSSLYSYLQMLFPLFSNKTR